MKPDIALKAVLNQAASIQKQLNAIQTQVETLIMVASSALEVHRAVPAPDPVPSSLGPSPVKHNGPISLNAFIDSASIAKPPEKEKCLHLHRTNIEVMGGGGGVQLCDDCDEQLS